MSRGWLVSACANIEFLREQLKQSKETQEVLKFENDRAFRLGRELGWAESEAWYLDRQLGDLEGQRVEVRRILQEIKGQLQGTSGVHQIDDSPSQ